jgi:hypothetical protein
LTGSATASSILVDGTVKTVCRVTTRRISIRDSVDETPRRPVEVDPLVDLPLDGVEQVPRRRERALGPVRVAGVGGPAVDGDPVRGNPLRARRDPQPSRFEDDCPVAAASSSERVPGSPVSSPIAAWTTTDPGRFPSRISGARSTAARIATARPVFMSAAPRP